MAQPRNNNERMRRAGAVFLIFLPIFLAGCTHESPAYVINRDRSQYPYTDDHRYARVTVREGDSLSMIAARCDTSTDELVNLNDIYDEQAIYPGEVLRVPSRGCAQWAEVPRPEPRPHYSSYGSSDSVRPEHRPDRYDSDQSSREEADNQSWGSWWSSWWNGTGDNQDRQSGSAQFIWPVHGPIIEAFGRDRRGERNDGINIATEEGAPIRAAASGVVTYTGNELRGYGNLVLIRHEGGYITAYAHAGSVRVERGDHVEKGQVIATVGETGDVDRPQLHFEIRRGSQAVDPLHYLGNRAS